jgi:lipoyl(octanoyl) transferase
LNRLRFIEESEFPGVLNMALDYYLAASEGLSGHDYTMRLYRWVNPTLSCGFHQKVDKRVNLEKCRQANVDVVRRPTGGRELMHDGDISFSISGKMIQANIYEKEFFNKAGEVIQGGLRAIGIDARLTASARKTAAMNQGPCLAAISQYEITVEGRKIVPIAQRVYQNSILIHGSIPLCKSKIGTAALLNVNDPEGLQKLLDEMAIDVGQLVDGELDLSRLKNGLIESFCRSFDGECEKLGLKQIEIEDASKTNANWMIV